MNLRKRLTKIQRYYLEQICSGRTVIVWDIRDGHYVVAGGEDYVVRVPHGKPAYSKRWCKRPWLGSVVVELRQRGLLVDDGEGRLVPSKAAAKLYGYPPPLPKPKRVVKMSETRAARGQ